MLVKRTSYWKSTGSVKSVETDGGDQDNDTKLLTIVLYSEEGEPYERGEK